MGFFVAVKVGVFILGNKHNYASAIKKDEAKDETIRGADIAYELRKIMRSYFPDLKKNLTAVADHRKRKDYGCDELLSAALAMFIFKAQSRNAVNNDRRHSGEFKSNFQKLFHADLQSLLLFYPGGKTIFNISLLTTNKVELPTGHTILIG